MTGEMACPYESAASTVAANRRLRMQIMRFKKRRMQVSGGKNGDESLRPPSLRQDDDAPGATANLNLADYLLAGQIHRRNVVGGPVGGVKRFAVRRESDTPRTLAHFKRSADFVGCCVDDKNLVSAAGADIQL